MMTMLEIESRLAEIGRLQAVVKEQAMIFDFRNKRLAAKHYRKRADFYDRMPCEEWLKIKARLFKAKGW